MSTSTWQEEKEEHTESDRDVEEAITEQSHASDDEELQLVKPCAVHFRRSLKSTEGGESGLR